MKKNEDIDEEVLEEACYYLNKVGLSIEKIAEELGIDSETVRKLSLSYENKIKSGKVREEEFDRLFWERVKKEAEGDIKLTFVSKKGFHHAWKSELERLDGETLMEIYESSKDFLNMDPNLRFVDLVKPKGYDPLALEREVRKAVEVIRNIIESKFNSSH
jgi:hypothetical protein